MFLDPEPKGKESSSRPNSPFLLAQPSFASQSSLASPRQQNFRIKRTSGENLSPSLKSKDYRRSTSSTGANSVNSTGEDGKPTVRLVNDSAISTPLSENVWPRNSDWTAGNHAPPHSPMLASYQPASASKTGSPATSRVSDIKAQLAKSSSKLDLPPIVTLPQSIQSRIASDPSRRSTSSKYSASGTSLYDTDGDVNSSFTGSDTSRPGRQSNRSTLNEEEILAAAEDKEGSEPLRTKAPALETVVETPSERSTAPSVSSSYIINDKHTARKVRSSSPDRSPKSSSPAHPWEQQKRTQYPSQESFGSSLPASSLSLPHSPTRPLTGQASAETFAYDRNDSQTSSSPNFIAYSSSSGHRSSDTPLHHAASSDSVQGQLGTPSVFRPNTSGGTEVQNSPVYSSPIHHYRSTSADLTSPVSSPRRQHEQVPSTPRSYSMDASHDMDYEEIDLEPWPRNQFSSHLSTIASVSDRAMSPSHFSHFSVGSGVYTIDDALSMSRNSGTLSTFSFGRRASEPLQSPTRKPSPQHTQHTQSSEEEPGDMTLGVYRAESAKPEPLFRGRQVTSEGDVRYDGPLPPLPPMPRSRHGNTSDETSDRLSALSAPSLKKQRSGYSMRGRSNSTPSGGNSRQNSMVSYCESERSSKGSSNLFPIWARNYYGGYAALLSASKISLHNPPTPRRENFQQQFKGHVRSASQWTQGSITSRLGTGYSEIDNVSPTSSHFLPAIFRPRTRTLGNSDPDGRSFKFGSKSSKTKSRVSQPDDQSRSDSMVITSVPQETSQSGDTLPSGHPKFGPLKDNSQNQPPMPPLPRKYSKQKLWDEMTFPRPMTKDRLSDFDLNPDEDPHLSPSKNQRSQINKYRSPSFVESFDTLFNSRGNRQILLFALGFLCPLFWLLGALLPLPPRHSRDASEAEKALPNANAESEDDLNAALNKHRSGDARVKWDEERVFLKAKWWRTLNRVMCFVGVAIIAAVVALAIIATR